MQYLLGGTQRPCAVIKGQICNLLRHWKWFDTHHFCGTNTLVIIACLYRMSEMSIVESENIAYSEVQGGIAVHSIEPGRTAVIAGPTVVVHLPKIGEVVVCRGVVLDKNGSRGRRRKRKEGKEAHVGLMTDGS